MEDLNISTYLHTFVGGTQKGTCKVCNKSVQWRKDRLGSHKRSNCIGVSDEEKQLFTKRKFQEVEVFYEDSTSSSSASGSGATGTQSAAEKKAALDDLLATLFFRTGIPFRVLDSAAFRDLIEALNPEYAKKMPSAHTLSTKLLDQHYQKASQKLKNILEEHDDLALVTDGWTNVNGHHIVNFVVKAPSQHSVFYKSIDTTGIIQDGRGVATEIGKVIEELGKDKFRSLVTDNANVMKASWKEVEEAYPKISAAGCAAHTLNLLIKDILSLGTTSNSELN